MFEQERTSPEPKDIAYCKWPDCDLPAQDDTSPKPSKPFITLVEVLVILAIIGILAALILPRIDAAGPKTIDRMKCVNNIKHIGHALLNYHEAYGSLPPVYTVDDAGNRLHSWRVLILPYFDNDQSKAIYERIKLDEPWNSVHNIDALNLIPQEYICPADRRRDKDPIPWTRYQVIVGPETLFPGTEPRPLPAKDDRNNTLLVVETTYRVHWMAPIDLPVDALGFGVPANAMDVSALTIGSRHSGGALAVMADGSCRFLGYDTTELREMSQSPSEIPAPTE